MTNFSSTGESPTAGAPPASVARGWFVSGTGTEVGKTYFSLALVRALRKLGREVTAIKPVETGCPKNDSGQFQPGDALALADACGRPELVHAPGLYRCAPALSPVAAVMEAALPPPPLADLVSHTRALLTTDRTAVVEGAGGILVPYDENNTFAELARAVGLPVVLVAKDELGVQSSVLTAHESAVAHGLQVDAIVLNRFDDADLSASTNAKVLAPRLPCPVYAGVDAAVSSLIRVP